MELREEQALLARGRRAIAGVDEVGRGAWAGPVAAAAVILPHAAYVSRELLWGVTDSKLLSAGEREHWERRIRAVATAVAIAFVPPRVIDRVGIAASSRWAMLAALERLEVAPEHVIVDAFPLPEGSRYGPIHDALVAADRRCLAVAAASICAKVARDRLMRRLHGLFPAYGFASHKGYGTRRHIAQLRTNGPSPLHRKSFTPVRESMQRLAPELAP